MQVFTHLWFEKDAEAAVRRYVSLLPDSRIERVVTMPADSPSGPPGSVTVIDFTLAGARYQAMEAGPLDPFNHAISLVAECETQAEIDRIWEALLADGGSTEQCGWLRDRWGVAWQIVPRILGDYMSGTDRARGKRVAEAMLKMVKLDIAALERAAQGE
jgi:predicted 3-demethylubiquinone-9 3-methyltransferase (glyoxalase superfamily)